ncbi:E2F-associated phosphoprotein domain containing protein-like [Tropilaelaps mercedesae]|uniref:E2F-associated phosphoprotein domain containing protein-like n=1 Tax=Tropilaelaps mercedesae TaxID=418985 RepID=A0A1V9XIG2_9ACAR|nr:E2F-associated phosphoprotein domain containing protein-like [Tropilaelaps mercedesae]
MTLLCRDCQRHEVYSNQYRAMFVENCRVDEATKLTCRLKSHAREGNDKSRKRRKGLDDSARATEVENNAVEDENAMQQEHLSVPRRRLATHLP